MARFRGLGRLVALGAILALVAVACTGDGGSDGEGTTGGSTGGATGPGGDSDCGTLEMAFNFDMQVPDPDIFYQADGLNVTQAAYEGLLRYKPNAEPPEIEPHLAESFEVSSDGLTYTFDLREGVTFHDGTEFNAEAMVKSFDRRTAVNAGPAFYTSFIDSTETPDPYTLIVHLKEPSNVFLGLVASPYGFKAVSPAAVDEHEVDDDQAQAWMATNSAGTGPYFINSFEPGEYELTRYEDYWGTDPFVPACYEKVHIRVIPDFTTQALELENGGLDLMIHGIAKNDLPRVEDQGVEVFRTIGINFVVMHLNTAEGPFSDPAIRAAVPMAIDRQTVVDEVWGSEGALVAESVYPRGTLPEGMGTYDVAYDPSQLQEAVDAGGWGDATIDFAYTTDDPVNEQIAGLIAAQLTAAGLNTTTRGVTQPETFEYPTKPELRPDALVLPATPDAINAWVWADLFYKNGGGLAYFSTEVCGEAEALTVEGLAIVDEDEANEVYAESARAYQECGAFIPIADVAETIVGSPGMSGFEHESDSLWALRLASLRGE
jgi:peptide/nickel transport system substrate-binding protein